MNDMLYTGFPLDRAAHLRRDPSALAALLDHPGLRLAPYWRGLSLVDGRPAAILAEGDAARRLKALSDRVVFLGLEDGGRPLFAIDLSGIEGGEAGPDLGLPGRWAQLRMLGGALPMAEASVLATARALLSWGAHTRHCCRCGAPTRASQGGHVMVCSAEDCAEEHFPRTDPAIIVLVTDGDRCLMGRQPVWPAGMWSCLAGFVEPGESLEEAVVREVREEAGIEVADMRYQGSQPWPFPRSLMVGFTARAVGGQLAADRHELEDARWFGRDEILAWFSDRHREDKSGRPFLPHRDSISRALIDRWLGG